MGPLDATDRSNQAGCVVVHLKDWRSRRPRIRGPLLMARGSVIDLAAWRMQQSGLQPKRAGRNSPFRFPEGAA